MQFRVKPSRHVGLLEWPKPAHEEKVYLSWLSSFGLVELTRARSADGSIEALAKGYETWKILVDAGASPTLEFRE